MNSYIHSLKEITIYLESLPIDPNQNALWDILHQARWHLNIDWVRWIAENKDLLNTIIVYSDVTKIPEENYKLIKDSMQNYKSLKSM